MSKVIIYTDGSCSGNPGPGGWAAVLTSGDHKNEISGGNPDTTSNRMELQAVLSAIYALRRPCCDVVIVTDSRNAIGWLSKGWKRKNPAIRALCQEIEAAIRTGCHEVSFEKVKGHSGHEFNERADQLAREAIPQ